MRLKTEKKSNPKKISHKRRILSSKDPAHIVLKTHLAVSLQGPQTLKIFKQLIKEVERRYGVIIFQFSVEKSHFHLFVSVSPSTPSCRISESMQFLSSKMALFFNRRFGRKGKFWCDRFYHSCKKSAREIVQTIFYIANQCKHKGPFENISSSIGQAFESGFPWGILTSITNRIGVGKSPQKLLAVIEDGSLPYQMKFETKKPKELPPMFAYFGFQN